MGKREGGGVQEINRKKEKSEEKKKWLGRFEWRSGVRF